MPNYCENKIEMYDDFKSRMKLLAIHTGKEVSA